MDDRQFDVLVRLLSAGNSRRRLLATLPALGGLLAILDPDDAESAGRRKRRKKAHKHGRGRRRQGRDKKKCKPQPVSETCAGACGNVTNNCKKLIDCGPCQCQPACPACQVCDEETSQCVADPTQQGDACGVTGQICQANGSCACDATSCPDCTTCGGDGQCTACADCCDGSGVCQEGTTNAACGSSGTCDVCSPPETCGGGGTPKQCGCTPQPDATICANKCGSVVNNCGQTVDCTPLCAGCCTGAICQPGTDNLFCGRNGGACDRCTSPQTCGGGGTAGVCGCTPACAGQACGASDGCGGICTTGSCPTDQTCQPNGTCLQNLNRFQCLCGDNTTPAECERRRCRDFDAVCSPLCTAHNGYFGFGTPGTSCGPGTCAP